MEKPEISFRSELNSARIEAAYERANRAHQRQETALADIGWRAAQARDPKLLIALEAMAELTGKMQEEQYGRTMRSSQIFGETKGTTEHQLCREAYRLCDEGRPIENFAWIYGAAAILCGYAAGF